MQGAFTALITPFGETGVDYGSLEKIVERQIENGIDGLVPVGTTGESPTLSHAEHKEVIRFVAEKAAGRCRVIAGAGSNSTEETIDFTAHAASVGADAVLLVCPYYNKPTQEGLYRHYEAVAKACDIDIVVYNIPGRSGVDISVDTFTRLAEIKNIVSVKDAAGKIDFVSEILKKTDGLSILAGDDSMTLPLMAAGGSGVISVLSNILPKEMKMLVDAMHAGNLQQAREIHLKLWNLFKVMFIKTNPIPIKTAAFLLGLIDSPQLRLPLYKLDAADEKALRDALSGYGLEIK